MRGLEDIIVQPVIQPDTVCQKYNSFEHNSTYLIKMQNNNN